MSQKNKRIHQIKVAIVILMALGVALSAIAPAFAAKEVIKEEKESIREKVSATKDEIREISEELSASFKEEEVTVGVPEVPRGFSFKYTLREGVRGQDARYMQAVLNADPDTRVAGSGPGSPGKETEYFGPATRNALKRFQLKHGILSTASLGLQTREKMNEILREGATIKRVVKKDTEHLKERLMGVMEKVKYLREMVDEIYSEKEEEELDGNE